MKISLNWLRELCEVDADPKEVAERLTFVGLEVEGIHDHKSALEKVIVVEVAEVQPHPNADKLKIVKVLDGEGTRSIVCGAPNVTVGSRVPLAEPGAVVGGKTIGVSEIRGVQSAGMLCSERELGLSDDASGLCELPADWALGKRLSDSPLGDVILEVSITPNRPDAMNHLGMARELAAAFGARVRKPRVVLREDGGDVGERVAVEIVDAQACRRYMARVVAGVKVEKSPLAVRARLFLLGTRPINNVVDATNWVMLEVGHPLHAFDLGRLSASGKQKKVIVRRAAANETLKTLDGQERKLTEEDLLIADSQKAIALAGIMGGEDSEIVSASGDVLVESAHFESSVVYKTSKRLGLVTEASSRFWRGADIDGLAFANDRCCQLLSEWADGKVCRGIVDVYPRRRQPLEISVRPKRLAEHLGVTVSAEEVAKYLTALELTVKTRTDQSITFGVPSFRVDLAVEVDLIEEVARLHGYDKIPERLPEAGGPFETFQQAGLVPDHRRLRELLASQGLSEAINYSFVSTKEEEALRPAGVDGAVALQNPMSEEQAVMRTSLLAGLLKNAKHNVSHQVHDLRLFEIGRVFHPRRREDLAGLSPRDALLPAEHDRLAILLHGPASPFGWGMPKREVDFFDIKRITEAIFEAWHLNVRYVPDELPEYFHPKAAARLVLVTDTREETIGYAGQVHPQTLRNLELEGSYFVADLDVRPLSAEAAVARYKGLPRFPGIRRDLAVIAKDDIRAGDVVQAALAYGKEKGMTLEQVNMFDVYQGKPIAEGHLSLALAFLFRHPERTLTDDEVQKEFDALVGVLKKQFHLEMRDA